MSKRPDADRERLVNDSLGYMLWEHLRLLNRVYRQGLRSIPGFRQAKKELRRWVEQNGDPRGRVMVTIERDESKIVDADPPPNRRLLPPGR